MPRASWIKSESATNCANYEVDPDGLTAEAVAAKIGLPPEQLFKTLVTQGHRHGICLAAIPGNTELDLKALAASCCFNAARASQALKQS